MISTIARQYLPAVAVLFVVACFPLVGGAAQSEKSKSTKAAPGKDEGVRWLLAGRDGACAPLSLLEKKGAEFRGIEGPADLAKKMRAAGHKVEVKEHRLASRPAVEVRVPERGLYVMFVKANLCDKMEPSAAQEQKRTR